MNQGNSVLEHIRAMSDTQLACELDQAMAAYQDKRNSDSFRVSALAAANMMAQETKRREDLRQ